MLDPMELRDRAVTNYTASSLEDIIDSSLRYDRETDTVSCNVYTSELTEDSLASLLEYKVFGYTVKVKAVDSKIHIFLWYNCSAKDN